MVIQEARDTYSWHGLGFGSQAKEEAVVSSYIEYEFTFPA